MEGGAACILFKTEVVGEAERVLFQVCEAESGVMIAETMGISVKVNLDQPHLWNGTEDPFLCWATTTLSIKFDK